MEPWKIQKHDNSKSFAGKLRTNITNNILQNAPWWASQLRDKRFEFILIAQIPNGYHKISFSFCYFIKSIEVRAIYKRFIFGSHFYTWESLWKVEIAPFSGRKIHLEEYFFKGAFTICILGNVLIESKSIKRRNLWIH